MLSEVTGGGGRSRSICRGEDGEKTFADLEKGKASASGRNIFIEGGRKRIGHGW